MAGGRIIEVIFYLCVLFAGVSSIINLYEAPVAFLQEKFKANRITATAIIHVIGCIVAICIQGIVSQWMDVVSIYIPNKTNKINNTGIIILFAFSIPLAIPIDIIIKLTINATTIQKLAPHADAVCPKVEPITSIFDCIAYIEPLIDIQAYLKTQPITQE